MIALFIAGWLMCILDFSLEQRKTLKPIYLSIYPVKIKTAIQNQNGNKQHKIGLTLFRTNYTCCARRGPIIAYLYLIVVTHSTRHTSYVREERVTMIKTFLARLRLHRNRQSRHRMELRGGDMEEKNYYLLHTI